ncbi:GNAT family N-acetyltransferase [Rubrivivax sp. A210]|uniref:GNAT family N-acetyltransferase n=1 Tax=Rubrivivax sp. A210 TaxID=2772301 RepID=UPI00191A4F78|nr:GNAT family protein [Rubrivivax sp. A210]CAD5370213.1 GNAT family N-acetyltransferase [Rubrivivax sp. A210]
MAGFEMLMLSTPRLLLRPLAEGDEAALMAIFSDPAVTRYWSSPPWTGIESAQAMIARDRAAMPAGDYLRLALERHADRTLIGTCTLFAFQAQCRRAELGYVLGSAYWGGGYMHEALLALLEHGFGTLALNRVEADIDPRNIASARSLQRLGFAQEGYLRERWIVGGEVSDTALYGLLQRDWRARTPGQVAVPAAVAAAH